MKQNILVIYTGGTIGMQPSDDGYVPVSGFDELLHQRLQPHGQQALPNFDVVEFEQLIDSSNLLPTNWQQIGRCIIDHYQQYDGFVVLHGTDTMGYTASALSFILQGLDKPVILTGSQIPLVELRNDAQDNLITSLMLAANYRIPEVCVYFNGRLLRGNRCSKLKATGFDAFDSPNFPWLAQVGIHIDLHEQLMIEPGPQNFCVPDYDSAAVTMLHLYPGIQVNLVRRVLDDNRIRGLIIHSFGVGNPPDANSELMTLLEQANLRGVVIVNLTQCLQGKVWQGAYATGSILNRIGVIPGSDLTTEAAFCKLHYLLATEQDTAVVKEKMQLSLCGEQS